MNWLKNNFLSILPFTIIFAYSSHLNYSWFEAKWIALYFCTIVAFAYIIFTKKKLFIPSFSTLEWLCISVLMALSLYNGNTETILDRLCFFSWCFIFYQVTTSFYPLLLWGGGIVSTYGIYQSVFNVGISKSFFTQAVPYEAIGSFFGYGNNAAQFVGYALLFCVMRFYYREARKIEWPPIVSMIIYLILLRTRSVMLGLGLSLFIFYFCSYGRSIKAKIFAATILICCAGFVLFTKGFVDVYRLALWGDTIRMIVVHPFGVGDGNFKLSILPYLCGTSAFGDGNWLPMSSHNEFLRFAAEDGIFYPIIFVILFISLFCKTLKNDKNVIIVSIIAYFFVESFFQFPFQNALTFLVMAHLFSSTFPQVPFKIVRTFLLIPILFLLVCLSTTVFISRYYENSDPIYSCGVMPSNWEACLKSGDYLYYSGNYFMAESAYRFGVQKHEHNALAYKGLSAVKFAQKDNDNGCKYLKKYDDEMCGTSLLHPALKRFCE